MISLARITNNYYKSSIYIYMCNFVTISNTRTDLVLSSVLFIVSSISLAKL